MTHDELLEQIDFLSIDGLLAWVQPTLLAVVELHKPIDNPNFPDSDKWCLQCAEGRGYAKWPCPTIQTIQKKLI